MIKCTILTVGAILSLLLVSNAQTKIVNSGTATLEARYVDRQTGDDNYVNAAYSFEMATNGFVGLKKTRNDWDVLFSALRDSKGNVVANIFDVTMVVDDRSRILDLGEHNWSEMINLPDLPAFTKPQREERVEALLGHIYFVHTADSDSDLYSLFRVDELKSGESVQISWKRLSR